MIFNLYYLILGLCTLTFLISRIQKSWENLSIIYQLINSNVIYIFNIIFFWFKRVLMCLVHFTDDYSIGKYKLTNTIPNPKSGQ
jgi:ABC-type amino acid transport system permease subunit